MPAILEYIPYRKNDATAPRDAELHPYLAAHGFACVRVDLRGSGDSEGILEGEYLQQELDDGVDGDRVARGPAVVQRARRHDRQVVGRLQRAADRGACARRRSAASSASARPTTATPTTSTTRAAAVFAAATLSWATTMLAYTARPPDPAVARRALARALARAARRGCRPFAHEWVAHQRRDAFWRHGSVCEDPGAIECHVEMVGGFADPYRGAVFRMLEAAAGPRARTDRAVGATSIPHVGAPGPRSASCSAA